MTQAKVRELAKTYCLKVSVIANNQQNNSPSFQKDSVIDVLTLVDMISSFNEHYFRNY